MLPPAVPFRTLFFLLACLAAVDLRAAPGDLDTGFGTAGKVTTAFGSGTDVARAVAIQPDGKIVVVGSAFNGSTNTFALARYTNAAGALDSSFGGGTGKVTSTLSSYSLVARAVALQPDGKIVVAGIATDTDDYFVLARYTAAGVLDTTFGGSGTGFASLGGFNSQGLALALQADGKILVAGSGFNGSATGLLIARYSAAGVADATFGTGSGRNIFVLNSEDAAQAVTVQPDGRILLAGYNSNGGSARLHTVVRVTSSGFLDNTFGISGVAQTLLPPSDFGRATCLLLLGDGRILVGGTNGASFVTVRLTAAGALDTTFNATGIVTTPLLGGDEPAGIALQADGRILLGGLAGAGPSSRFGLVRYTTAGALDTTFGGGTGKVTTAVGTGASPGYGFALQPDGKAVVVGSAVVAGSTDFALARYQTDASDSVTLSNATTVPLESDGFVASGKTLNLTLAFAPTPPAAFTIVRNTGRGFIGGTYSNVAQGQTLALSFGGVTYNYVANYFGGTGNDLVLQPAGTRAVAWGANGSGQLGDNSTTNRLLGTSVLATGVLAGKTVLSVVGGGTYSVALCSDGTLASWGSNGNGELGNNSTTPSSVPVAVVQTGVLNGRRPVAIAAGNGHALVLCSDGTLAAWGFNAYGQLGDGTLTNRLVPVLVNTAGLLAGKQPVAIAAGNGHSLALCSDGTVAAWGYNLQGEVGDGTTNPIPPHQVVNPVAVSTSGVLAGRSVLGIAAGGFHSLAFTADGGVVSWGRNNAGQLGTGDTTDRPSPVNVTFSKRAIGVGAGQLHSLVRFSDQAVAAWGENGSGQVGDSTTITPRPTPQELFSPSVLGGRTIVGLAGGSTHSLAYATDGAAISWGSNASGELGVNSTFPTSQPNFVSQASLLANERILGLAGGVNAQHSVAFVASTVPAATTVAATPVTTTSATLRANVVANGTPTTVIFDYGLTTAYGSTIAVPGTVGGGASTPVSATLAGLPDKTTYHYRVRASSLAGAVVGSNVTFTTGNADLSNLTLSAGALSPAFSPGTNAYNASAAPLTTTATVTPTAAAAGSIITVNGVTTSSGVASAPLTLGYGNNRFVIVVTAQGGGSKVYLIEVFRLPPSPLAVTFNSASDVGLVSRGFQANGPLNLTLNHTPTRGADLMIVKNTGPCFTTGYFDDLYNGAPVALSYAGSSYEFVINYYGGDGNDIVLQWANTTAVAWGGNATGAVGDGSQVDRRVLTRSNPLNGLSGKTVLAARAGEQFSVALASDGRLSTWGLNAEGQLGIGSTTDSLLPVPLELDFLLGRAVVAQAGSSHALVLTDSGRLVGWGRNVNGQVGIPPNPVITTPYAIPPAAFGDRTIGAFSTGGAHNLVLCTDGALLAFGYGQFGQLGTGSGADSAAPVVINPNGALAGREVLAFSAGHLHSLAVCTDGTVLAWGRNDSMQLGNTGGNAFVPTVVAATGALAGKTVVAVAAGQDHSLALCSDGTLAAWGGGLNGQLGQGAFTSSAVPVAVIASGALAGKTVVSISAGGLCSLARCSDGTVVTWGINNFGQLANNGAVASNVPVAIHTTALAPAEALVGAGFGVSSAHAVALVSNARNPVATYLPISNVTAAAGTVNLALSTTDSPFWLRIKYGLNFGYQFVEDHLVPAAPGVNLVSFPLANLLPDRRYEVRVELSRGGAEQHSLDFFFTLPVLASTAAATDVSPTSATLQGAVDAQGASVQVFFDYGPTTAYGSSLPATPPSLSGSGLTPVSAVVSPPPLNLYHYRVRVTHAGGEVLGEDRTFRTQFAFSFNAPDQIGASDAGFEINGFATALTLSFAPPPGSILTVLENRSPRPLGRFTNLAHGQVVTLPYGGTEYRFVANYYGGAGNDLTLHALGSGLAAWGPNELGQLGDGTGVNRKRPIPLPPGALAGKTVVSVSAAFAHSLALCSDGTLATWGSNDVGQLGNGGTGFSATPVVINGFGALAGRTVVAAAARGAHNVVLCSDGAVITWGFNGTGELGNNSTTSSALPIEITGQGALAGKTVVAVRASAALCSDGTLAVWGADPTVVVEPFGHVVPTAMDLSGLGGRAIADIFLGTSTNLLVCADGSLAVWGNHFLGPQGTERYPSPQLVSVGALAGRSVRQASAGSSFIQALCRDGALVAWGTNGFGEVGVGTYDRIQVPTAIENFGALAGRVVSAARAEEYHSAALATDGTLLVWGFQSEGELGNGTLNSSALPVLADLGAFTQGERLSPVYSVGRRHSLAIVGAPPAPVVALQAASNVGPGSATLHGTVSPNGSATTAWFEYGLTTAYGSTAPVTLTPNTGFGTQAVSFAVPGVTPGTRYHYRLVASNAQGTRATPDGTFSNGSTNANLAALSVSAGTLVPAFSAGVSNYSLTVPSGTASTTVTATLADSTATLTVQGAAAASGVPTGAQSLGYGENTLTIATTAQDAATQRTYTVTITRSAPSPLTVNFTSAAQIGLQTREFGAAGNVTCTLGFAPLAGTNLMVVENIGQRFVGGSFANLAHGQSLTLSFGGVNYRFVANYYGGTGNDLVLQWAEARAAGFGANTQSELGDGTTQNRPLLTEPLDNGVLRDRTVVSVRGGTAHSLALCADGTLVAWGQNDSGQLGLPDPVPSAVPVVVPVAGALVGKTVVAIACGSRHNLALCSDGSIAAWGLNSGGQLGNQSTGNSFVPVAVDATGYLLGRSVVAIAAGTFASYAVCADGTVAAWGNGSGGQLGSGFAFGQLAPAGVVTDGALAGRKVVALAAGSSHVLALCADGTLVAWGSNVSGMLGNDTMERSNVPITINSFGVLAGRTVTAISAAANWSSALCSDGTIATWGTSNQGQLGDGTFVSRLQPGAVSATGVLAGRTATTLFTGSAHGLVGCSDGTFIGWGGNFSGQLGDGTIGNTRPAPVLVSTSPLGAGERLQQGSSNPGSTTRLMLASLPNPKLRLTSPTQVLATTATLQGRVNPSGNATTAFFDYGLDTSYGTSLPISLAPSNGIATQTVSAPLTGLAPGTAYHYRLRGSNAAGAAVTADGTFTTLTQSEAWRLLYFGSPANAGNAADLADPNANGIVNLLEYALGGDPLGYSTGQSILPVPAKVNNRLQITFTRQLDRGDLVLTVQGADSLLGPWANLARSTAGAAFVVLAPGANASETGSGNTRSVTIIDPIVQPDPAHPRRFLRLEVAR